jgi:HAMP domain-containing protein
MRTPRPEISASRGAERRGAPIKSAENEPSFRSIYWSDLRVYWQGLTGKMIATFAGIVAIFGFAAVGIVYYQLANAILGQATQRATITAVNLSDSVPAYLLAKDTAKLRELLRNHASKPGIAYALVENRAGAIVADSFAVVPDEFLTRQPVASGSSYGQRKIKIGAATVYEATVPVLEGQRGAVRVGIWKDDVDAEIDQTVLPIVKLLLMVFAAGIFMAILVAWNVSRPILRLVRSARRISHGDLDAPSLGVQDTTEFGELSRALERMRSSIKAALVRLS